MMKRNRSKIYMFIVLGILCLQNSYGQKNERFINLNASDFYIMLNEQVDALLVDARDLKAYKKIKIEGSVNLECKQHLQSYCDSLDKETPILVYCDVGSRSKQACKFIKELGFEYVYNLKGGLYKWQSNDYPVVEFIKE